MFGRLLTVLVVGGRGDALVLVILDNGIRRGNGQQGHKDDKNRQEKSPAAQAHHDANQPCHVVTSLSATKPQTLSYRGRSVAKNSIS